MKDELYVKFDRTKEVIEDIQRKIIQEYNSTEKEKINKSVVKMIDQLNQLRSSHDGFIKLDDVYNIIDENDLHDRLINELFAQHIYNRMNHAKKIIKITKRNGLNERF